MRRRLHLTHVAVRTANAAGPTALAVTVASTPTTVAAAPTAKPTTMPTATAATDPSSYAQKFVSAWLRSNAHDNTSTQTRLAQSMAPDIELPDPAAHAQSAPQHVTAARSARTTRGR